MVRFSLNNVEKGSVIQVSFIGYQTQEIAWNGQPLTLTLKEDSRQLEEVIVVGFGTQKKENLTGSVSQVSMDEVLGDRPVTSAAAAFARSNAWVNNWWWFWTRAV